MRILFFSPRVFWPANSGARIRDYYLLRMLARKATVTFLGICLPGESKPPAELKHDLQLHELSLVPKAGRYSSWNVVRGFVGPTPLNIRNYSDTQVARQLQQLMQDGHFDLVQIEGIHLAGYLPLIRSAPGRPLVICDWHDVESDRMSRYSSHAPNLAQSIYAKRTAALLRNAERKLLLACDAHVVVSPRDLEMIRALAPQVRAQVIQNGVDVAFYGATEAQAAPGADGRTHLVFVGSMDFHPNIDAVTYFALEVWPKIRAQAPGLEFVIVGSNPVASVRELAKLPGVIVTGTVADVRPYYRSALLALAPLRIAGGTRLKILEAMATGVPVVATHTGAEGLAVEPERDFLLGDTPEQMAGAVLRLQQSPDLRRCLSQRGRELVAAHYDWAALGESLYRMHCDLLARRHG